MANCAMLLRAGKCDLTPNAQAGHVDMKMLITGPPKCSVARALGASGATNGSRCAPSHPPEAGQEK